jgi:hypothetical protein
VSELEFKPGISGIQVKSGTQSAHVPGLADETGNVAMAVKPAAALLSTALNGLPEFPTSSSTQTHGSLGATLQPVFR